MRVDHRIDLQAVFSVVVLILSSVTTPNAAWAEDKTYVMKLGTATINESQHEWCKRFVAMVEKDSGGRIKGEIYPASQLGAIPRQIEGVQFGAIQGYVGPPEFFLAATRGFMARLCSSRSRHWSSHVRRSLTSPTSPARSFGCSPRTCSRR